MLQKINDAECIVFGTPVFWIGMSGQLKLFIDKFVARQNIFKQKPKKTVSVVVGGSGPKTRQYELIAEQFLASAISYVGTISAPRLFPLLE